jgi:hypothetical protein
MQQRRQPTSVPGATKGSPAGSRRPPGAFSRFMSSPYSKLTVVFVVVSTVSLIALWNLGTSAMAPSDVYTYPGPKFEVSACMHVSKHSMQHNVRSLKSALWNGTARMHAACMQTHHLHLIHACSPSLGQRWYGRPPLARSRPACCSWRMAAATEPQTFGTAANHARDA